MKLYLHGFTIDHFWQYTSLKKITIMAGFYLCLTAMGYCLVAKPNLEQYNQLQANEVMLKREFELKQAKASILPTYRAQFKRMQTRFAHDLHQLPTQIEMPAVVDDISKIGIACGLTFDLIAPLPEVSHPFYVELPIKIEVVGHYHQVTLFLSRIAQMSRIVTVHDFVIVADSTSKQKGNFDDRLTLKMTAKIYRCRAPWL